MALKIMVVISWKNLKISPKSHLWNITTSKIYYTSWSNYWTSWTILSNMLLRMTWNRSLEIPLSLPISCQNFMNQQKRKLMIQVIDWHYPSTTPDETNMSCSNAVSLSDIVKHCNNSYQNVSKEYFLKRNNMTLDRNVLFKSFNKITKISTDLKNLIKVTWWVT